MAMCHTFVNQTQKLDTNENGAYRTLNVKITNRIDIVKYIAYYITSSVNLYPIKLWEFITQKNKNV